MSRDDADQGSRGSHRFKALPAGSVAVRAIVASHQNRVMRFAPRQTFDLLT